MAAIGAGAHCTWASDTRNNLGVLLRVELRPQVDVMQPQVALGDIAKLSSVDLSLLRRAMALPLGSAPRLGDIASLDSERVQRWVFSQTGLRPQQVEWTGATSTDVRTAGRQVSGVTLVDAAQASLQKHLEVVSAQDNQLLAKVELHPFAIPMDVTIPASATTLRVRPLDNVPVAKRMLVWVDVFAAEQFLRAIPVRFEVSVFATVPTAAHTLARAEVLDPTKLVQRETDVTTFLGNGRPSLTGFANYNEAPIRLRRAVQSGEIVTAAHVEKAPAILRGEWANLTAQQGLVALESRVEVLQDAYMGQMVRVKQANATSAVSARVTGPGRLEMQP